MKGFTSEVENINAFVKTRSVQFASKQGTVIDSVKK
jgi:hypothetical protein